MIILGIDLGKARTGVAVCDRAEMLASPLCVIHERSKERLLERIAQLSEERRAEQIALGLPKNYGWLRRRKRPKRPGIWSASARKDRPAGSLCG